VEIFFISYQLYSLTKCTASDGGVCLKSC
jgi:hypothetical protein